MEEIEGASKRIRLSTEFFRFLSREEANEALSRNDITTLQNEGMCFRAKNNEQAFDDIHEWLRLRVRFAFSYDLLL